MIELTRKEIMDSLKEGVYAINFTKVNGESRDMNCTLQEEMLPKIEDDGMQQAGLNPKKQVNENTVAVWDLDINAWRSFRLDSLTKFERVPT